MRQWSRQWLVVCLAVALLTVGAGPVTADNVVVDSPTDLGLEVTLAPIATVPDNSFGDPPRLNAMATQGDHLYIVAERDGLIYELVESGTVRQTQLYFDVSAAISAASSSSLDTTSVYHGGLRSLAFHPDFASNGLLYVSAMVTRAASPTGHHYLSDVTNPIAADSVLIEFTADPQTGVVDPLSYREVFRVGMPVYDHPIKQIAFNPFSGPGDADYGLLFIGHGDASVQSATAGGGQNNDALGKILRIDPRQGATLPFAVPPDNPFVGDPNMIDEVYSLGHRNPHQLSFAQDGADSVLIVAEPGRDNVEEINLIQPGQDFGWPQREGTFVHLAQGGVIAGVSPLPVNDATFGFTYPAAQYGHDGAPGSFFNGAAIAGGHVVDNGSELSGQYFFADFPKEGTLFHTSSASLTGSVTLLDPNDPAIDEPSELTQAPIGIASILFDHDHDPATPALPRQSLLDVFNDSASYTTTRADVRLGQGPDGELYISSKRNNTIYLVTNSLPAGPESSLFTALSEPCPIFDSNSSLGALGGVFEGNELRTIQIAGPFANSQGVGNTSECIPQTATAAMVNISAVAPQNSGNLRLSQAAVSPNGGVINFAANGLNNANTVTVPLSADGRADVFANGGPSGAGTPLTNVRMTIVGYYSPQSLLGYTPLVPCAVADSRTGVGPYHGPFSPGANYPDIDVVGAFDPNQGGGNTDCGVPASAAAVIANLVAVNPSGGAGALAAGSGGTNPTEASTSFAPIGMNNSSAVMIPIDSSGTVAVNISGLVGAQSQVRIVVLGYLSTTGASYMPVNPCAVFDTRSNQGGSGMLQLGGSTTSYQVTGMIPPTQGGLNGGDCGVPSGASGVLINLVATNSMASGNLQAFATGTSPTGGVLNFGSLNPAMNNSNAVPIPLSSSGQLSVFVNGGPSGAGQPLSHVRGVVLGYFS